MPKVTFHISAPERGEELEAADRAHMHLVQGMLAVLNGADSEEAATAAMVAASMTVAAYCRAHQHTESQARKIAKGAANLFTKSALKNFQHMKAGPWE